MQKAFGHVADGSTICNVQHEEFAGSRIGQAEVAPNGFFDSCDRCLYEALDFPGDFRFTSNGDSSPPTAFDEVGIFRFVEFA